MKKPIIIIAIVAILGSAQFVMKHWGLFPFVIIKGQIINENGKPIENASVFAKYGLNYEAPETKTSNKGKFTAFVYSDRWDNHGKGPPLVNITAPGYTEYWGYFIKQKPGGITFYSREIKLTKGDNSSSVKENL